MDGRLSEALGAWHDRLLHFGAMRGGLTQSRAHVRLAAFEKLERRVG